MHVARGLYLRHPSEPDLLEESRVRSQVGLEAGEDGPLGRLERLLCGRSSGWDTANMPYPLPQNRQLDPPLWEILREAAQGEGIMMISYGYSGAGKTTTLIGDSGAPVGKGKGIDGVLAYYLQENAAQIDAPSLIVIFSYSYLKNKGLIQAIV